MTSEEINPATPRQAKLQLGRSSPLSPSTQLADTFAGIKLHDSEEPVLEQGSLASILQEVTEKLNRIQEQFFTIQEKRHAGVFALSSSKSKSEASSSSPSQNGGEGEKSVALDVAMAQLNALLESASENMKAADLALKNLIDDNSADTANDTSPPPRERTGSIASLSSLDSFDDAFLNMDAQASKPAVLKKRYQEISDQWAKVQSEARRLEEELSGDKYILVFSSICEQMEGMMDSLDKALSSCHTFIFTYHRERAESSLIASSPGSFPDSQWNSKSELLTEFKSVKRSFEVKKSTYGPACEQMFISLEKGVKQRSTQNGTILRKLSEMKSRWRNLRDKVVKMGKDLKGIEMHITQPEASGSRTLSPSKGSPGESFLSPNRHSLQPKSQLRARMGNATISPTSMNRSVSSSDILADTTIPTSTKNGTSRLNSQATGAASTPSPPTKPAKSANRRSVSGESAHLYTRSNTGRAQHVSPSAFSNGSQQPYGRFDSNAEDTSRSFRTAAEAPEEGDTTALFHHYDPSADMSMENLRDVNDSSFSSSASVPQRRTSSAMGNYQRPPSVNGSYYRPPSAAGHRSEADGPSRIPRLSMGRSAASNAGDRPGSALSMASTTGFGTTPTKRLTSAVRGQHPPSSFMNHDRGNRLSMQTPEPMIAARAQRMNMFAAPRNSNASVATGASAKRSSRPPPARYNASLYGGASNNSSSVDSNASMNRGALSASPSNSSLASGTSPSSYRGLQPTRPLNINKRTSMLALGTPSGRATPLSAAALAKVPHAGPDFSDQVNRNSSGASASSVSGSRPYENGRGYAPSALSGRATPTFSEGGASSIWGAGGSAARRNAALYSYRANPNDAIDVEVANIVNSLGMTIQRVDPPLPRGVRDLTPSSTKTVKYEVGGKQIACKLLQLHRPASLQTSQEKTNKVLTRVGGGWIDLRQYLLSRLGTA